MSWLTDIFDTIGSYIGTYTPAPSQPSPPTPPTVYMPVAPRPSQPSTPAPSTPTYTPPPMTVVPRGSGTAPISRTPINVAPAPTYTPPQVNISTPISYSGGGQASTYSMPTVVQPQVTQVSYTPSVAPAPRPVQQQVYTPLSPRAVEPYTPPKIDPTTVKRDDWWKDPGSNQAIVNMGMTGSGQQGTYAPVNPRPLDPLPGWNVTAGPQVPSWFSAPDTFPGKVERELYTAVQAGAKDGAVDYLKNQTVGGQTIQGIPRTAQSWVEWWNNPSVGGFTKAAGETVGTVLGLKMAAENYGLGSLVPSAVLPVLNAPTAAIKESTGALQEGQDIYTNDYGARWKMAQEAKAAGKSRDEVNKILFGDNRDLTSYAQETASLLGQDYAKKYRESSRVNILGMDFDIGDAAKYVPERDNPVNYAVKETRDMAFSGNNALRVQAQNRILAGEDPAVAIDGAYAPGPNATMDQQQLWQTRVNEFIAARGRLARVNGIKAGWTPAQVSQAEQDARVEAQQLINNTGIIPGSKDVITDMVGEIGAGFVAGATGLDPFPKLGQKFLRATKLDRFVPKTAAEKRADWLDEIYVPEMEKKVAADVQGLPEKVYKEGERAAATVADPNTGPVDKAFAKMYLAYTELKGRTERAQAGQQAQSAIDFVSRLTKGADSPWTVIQRFTGMIQDPHEVMRDAPELGNIPISVRAELAKPVMTSDYVLKELPNLESLNQPEFNHARFMVEFQDLAQRAAARINGVGEKPPTALEKIVGAQKAVMGEMYLRNPGYVFKQVMSDYATMAADGVVSFDSRAQINDFFDRMGVSKPEISNELNALGDPQGRESLWNKVPVVGKVLAAIPDKVGDIAAQWDFDRRVRAQYAGTKKYLEENWKPILTPEVRQILGDNVADAFEANLRGALSTKELREVARRHYDPKGAGDSFSATQWMQKAGIPLDSISPQMLVQMENGARELANRGATPEETKTFFDKWRGEIDKHWRKNVASMGDVVNPRQTTENVARSDIDEVQHGATQLVKDLVEVGGMKPDEAVKRIDEVMTPLVKGEDIIRKGRESLAEKLSGIVDKPDVDVNKVASLLNWAMNKEYELRGDYRQQQAELYRKARTELDNNRRGPTAAEAWAGQVWREYFDNNRRNATKMHDDVANAYHWTAGAVDNFLAGADWNTLSKEQPDLMSIESYAQKVIDSTRAQMDAQGADGFSKMLASDRVKGDQARQELFRRAVVTMRADPSISTDLFDVLMTAEKDVRMNAAKAATEAEIVRDQMVTQGMDMKDYYTRIGEIWKNHFDFAEQRNSIAMTQLAYTQARNSEMGRMLQGLGYNDKAIAQMFARMDTADGKAAVQKEIAAQQQKLAAMAAQAEQAKPQLTNEAANVNKAESAPAAFTESPNRDRVETYLREQFKDLPDNQMKAAMAVMDARAELWGKQNNTSPDGWYASRLGTAEDMTAKAAPFEKWFGRSKIVNPDGSPKEVYHFTVSKFDTFDLSKLTDGRGFYFTDNPKWDSPLAKAARDPMPVYLKMENPFNTTWTEYTGLLDRTLDGMLKERKVKYSQNGDEFSFPTNKDSELYLQSLTDAKNQVRKELEARGYDGVVVKADPSGETGMMRSTTYVVFDPANIKSSRSNSGEFDPNNPNIYKQGPKGAVEFLDDGRAVIKALESPDISTLMHEVGHVFRRDLQGEDMSIASEWAGAKKLDNGEWQWGRDAEEKFARGFEKYLQDGEAPNVGLRRVFDQFKTWLTTIYSKLRGVLPDTLNDNIRGVYDRLLAERVDQMKPPASAEEFARMRAAPDMSPDTMRTLLSEAQRQQERVRGEAMFGRMDQLKEAAAQGPDRATIHQWLQPNGEPRKVITLGGKRYEFKNGWVDAQGGGLDKTIDEFNQRYAADENRTGGAAQAWFDTLTKARSTYSEMKALADGDKRTMKRVAKSAENAMGGWQKIIDDLQTRIGEGAKSEADQAARQAMTEAGGDVDKAIESLTTRYADQPEQFAAALDALQNRQSEPALAAADAPPVKQPIDQLVDAVKSLVDTLQPKPEPAPQRPAAPPEPSPRDKIRQIITMAARGELTSDQAQAAINKIEPMLRDMTRTEEQAARSLSNQLADGQPRYIQPTARIGGEQINTGDVLPRLGATQDAPGVWRLSKDQAAELSQAYDRMMTREGGQPQPTQAGPSLRDSILRQYRKEFSQMSDTEYGAVARMLDARAGAWAAVNGSTPDAWYESKFVNPNDKTDPRAKRVTNLRPKDVIDPSGAFMDYFHDGKAIIHAVQRKDFLALTHEIGHLFRMDLSKPELDTVSEWAGAQRKKDGTWEWDIRSEEKFAESFADYATGKVSNEPLLAKIYRKFDSWVGHFLAHLIVDITPSKEVKQVFDRLMGEYPELQQVAKQAQESPRVLYQDQPTPRPEDEEMAGTDFAKKNGLYSRASEIDPETLARYQDKAVEAGAQENVAHMLDINDAVHGAGKKAIDAIEKGFADHVANWQPGEKVYSGQERGMMQKELLRLTQQHSEVFSKAREYGKQLQNSSLLDYSDKRGIDTYIQLVAPFAYWGTRQGRNYALRAMANPNLVATYWRYQQAVEAENKKKNVRGRFGASLQVPGTNLYVDPTPWLFPFSDFMGRDSMADAGEAKSAAQKAYDLAGMVGIRPGPLLDIPLRYSNLLVNKSPGEQGYGAQEAEYGRGSIGELLPLNGIIQAATAAFGIGGPTGFDAEGRLRKMLGMHEAETWEPYVISRSNADMAAQANRNGGPMYTRAYLIAQRFVDDNQSNIPTALRESTAQQLSDKYHIDPQTAQQALDIARRGALTATLQKGTQQMFSFFTGLRVKQLPPGEQARWQMKQYEKGAAYNPYTDTGSRKQLQQVQDFFPALQVQRAQYGAVPGDEKNYNYLYVIEEKKRLNAKFDDDLANIIRERPWDRDAAKEIDGMRFNILHQLDQMQGTTPPDETKPSSIYGANKAEALQIRQNDILRLVSKQAPKVENFESYDQYKSERDAYRSNVASIAAGNPQTQAILQLADKEGNGDALRKFIGGLTYNQVSTYKGRYDLPLEAAQNAYFDLVYEPAILDYNRQLVRGDPRQAWENTIGRVGAVDANALASLIKQQYGGRWSDEELAQGLQGMSMPILAEMIKRKYEVAADGGFKYRQDYLYGANNIDPQTEFWRWYRNEIPPGRAANGLRDIPQISMALDPAAAAKMTPAQWESALNLGRAWMASEFGDVPPDARVEWAQAKDESKQLNTLLMKEFGPEGQKLLDMYFNAPDAKTKAAMRKAIPMLDALLDMRQVYAEKKAIYDAYYGPGSYGNKKNAQGKYYASGSGKSGSSGRARYSRGGRYRGRSSSRSYTPSFNYGYTRGYTGYIVRPMNPSSGLGPIEAPKLTPRKVKMNPLKG